MKKMSYGKKIAKENLMSASALLLVLLLLALFTGLYISHIFNARDSIMICAGIFIGASFYYMIEKVLKVKFLPRWGKYKGFTQGAIGEALVHDALIKNLGNGNLILADVELEEKKYNIDHIIIGKYGIFVIETKTHRGRIVCDGDTWFRDWKIGERTEQMKLKYSPSKQAKGNVIHLKSFLKQYYPKLSEEWIWAIVVFTNKQSEKDHVEIKTKPNDCEIFDSIPKMIEEMKKEKISVVLTSDDLTQLENIFKERVGEIIKN
jgi:hypothetical protein